MGSEAASQQFCVRWNSHLGSLGAAFPQLLAGQRFVDVTLACEGHQLHCHRLVLAACSTYFESLLGENPCKHPIIILPRDIRLWEIQALVDFMYKGEVNVSQAGLSDLLKCAETLQIRGLCGSDAALNLNQVNSVTNKLNATSSLSSTSVPSNSSAAPSSASNLSSTHPAADAIPISPNSLSNPTAFASSQSNAAGDRPDNSLSPTSDTSATKGGSSSGTKNGNSGRRQYGRSENSLAAKGLKNEHSEGDQTYQQASIANRTIGKVEPVDMSMEEDIEDQELNQANEKGSYGSFSNKFADYLDGSKGEHQLHLTQTQQQLQQLHAKLTSSSLSTSLSVTASVATSKLNLSSFPEANSTTTATESTAANGDTSNNDTNRSCVYDEAGDIYIINDVDDEDVENQPDVCVAEQHPSKINPWLMSSSSRTLFDSTPPTNFDGSERRRNSDDCFDAAGLADRSTCHGKIRVKSKENLFDSYGSSNKSDSKSEPCKYGRLRSTTLHPASRDNRRSLPGALRFNRNSMTVFLKSPKLTANTHQANNEDAHHPEAVGQTYETKQIKTEIECVEDNNYENIVCLPSVMEMYGDEVEISVAEVDQYNGSSRYDSTPHILANSEYEDIKIDDEIIYGQSDSSPNGLLHYNNAGGGDGNFAEHDVSLHQLNRLDVCTPNRRPVESAMAQFLSDHIFADVNSSGSDRRRTGQRSAMSMNSTGLRYRLKGDNSETTSGIKNRNSDHLLEPTLSAVVLRNPRSNQPRTYSNDALYAALMDVKAGESIYRASQIHKVPRKTLRNWMKRWHIKSAYPMPRQLKQAAEKKKRIQQQMEEANSHAAIDTNHTIRTNTSAALSHSSIRKNCYDNNSHTSANMLQSSCRKTDLNMYRNTINTTD